ncbi:aldehyde dehydrogenase family protein [Nocardia sp. NPDC050630]|uniref:aldehyde dehydrogenase family protein n=1 Tax=Nocardia sp. NPDC050630 TaxID=3364321 RepID=UPI00378A59D9
MSAPVSADTRVTPRAFGRRIVKPSPFTPLCDLKLVELVQDLLPPGVLSVVSGDDELGKWMTAHEGIAKIAFTGSTDTGKHVMRRWATRRSMMRAVRSVSSTAGRPERSVPKE